MTSRTPKEPKKTDPDTVPKLLTPGEVREKFMKHLRCGYKTYYEYYHPYLNWKKIHPGHPVIAESKVMEYINYAIEHPIDQFQYADRSTEESAS